MSDWDTQRYMVRGIIALERIATALEAANQNDPLAMLERALEPMDSFDPAAPLPMDDADMPDYIKRALRQ